MYNPWYSRYAAEMPDGLRAVLFDSGGVLMQPSNGRWNPRGDFEEILLEHIPALTAEDFAAAIAVGDTFLAVAASTPPLDDYHRVMLGHLGIEPTERLLADLQRPVDPRLLVETFPEVLPTLTALRERGVRMAVVSDAWPVLREVHAALGVADFFEAYAISAVLGCNKPDPRMYRHASDALGLAPHECLFLDDSPHLVAAAIDLGYQGRAVLRTPPPARCPVPSVTTIDEILALF